jgi:hypothetical protein
MTNFLLLNSDFFFDASGPAQKTKGSARALFWGWFLWHFFSSKLFFNLRGISVDYLYSTVGALSESKILKMSGHERKPLKLGTPLS